MDIEFLFLRTNGVTLHTAAQLNRQQLDQGQAPPPGYYYPPPGR